MFERFNIHDTAFGLLRDTDCGLFEQLRVLFEQFIGRIGNRLLCLHRLLAVCKTECKHHLTLPQRDRIEQCRLDLLDHQGIVVLDQSDLRAHLQRHSSRQIEVVQLLLEAVRQIRVIVRRLCILHRAGLSGLCLHRRNRHILHFLKLFLACHDV